MNVTDRFTTFLNNIALTETQQADGATKRESVCKILNSKYYSSASGTDNSFYIGSWGKRTRIRPPRDVDVLFKLPYSVYERFQQKPGNKQSQLLQEVKNALLASFPKTDIRGDGPVVMVPFQSYAVELLPGFLLQNGQYWIPITANGGSYKTFDPDAEIKHIQESNTKTNGNTRDLVRMLKCWQAHCAVPLKSFYLELLAVKFLDQWAHAGQSKTYYDWMTRDFFGWLVTQAWSTVYVPGTRESLSLGDAWRSKAGSAHDRAAKATQYDAGNMPYSAGEEWQKVFGIDIPVS